MRMNVAGQSEGIFRYPITVDHDGPFVTMRLEGTDGTGYATLTPDQAEALGKALADKARIARSNLGIETP